MRRRFLTLIEVMVSAALVLFLVSALMGFYKFSLSSAASAQALDTEAMQTLYLRERLARVLTRATKPPNKEPPFWFYTTTINDVPSLIFTYDAGARAQPLFSNVVLGRLFVLGGKLILLTWPTLPSARQPHPPMQTEVIAEDVQSFQWSFYNLPDTNKSQTPIENELDKQGWVESWPQEKAKLPALVRLEIKRKGKKKQLFTFPLLQFEPPLSQVSL